jgi:hypothetical protein
MQMNALKQYVSHLTTPAYSSAPAVPPAISLNVAGLGPGGKVVAILLDGNVHRRPGYSAGESSGPGGDGFRQRAPGERRIGVVAQWPIRLHLDFGGVRPEDLRLYTVNVESDRGDVPKLTNL